MQCSSSTQTAHFAALPLFLVGLVLAAAPVDADVLVKFKKNAETRAGRHVAHPASVVVKRVFPLLGWHRVSTVDAASTKEILEQYRNHPDVEWAELSRPVKKLAQPDDPRYGELWALEKIGAPAAWNTTKGAPSIVVGIVDTGVDFSHPDLNFNAWRNPGEVPGNFLDDDGNGYVDDVHGIDAVENDGDPHDDDGHGTHVAGTIGATGDNGIGVTGVNWNVSLMGLRIGRADGFGETADIMAAFEYAVAMKSRGVNLRVLNNSWGSDFPSQAIREAFHLASTAGILLVCAAGNSSLDSDYSPGFPATFDAPGTISVAASDEDDQPATFTNFGRESVHLAAPGVSILSTLKGGRFYASFQGTSMASPHVAGAAALLLAQRNDLTPGQIKAVLLDTVDRLPAWEGKVISGGRLNLARAMERVLSSSPIPETSSARPGPRPPSLRPLGPPIHAISRAKSGALGSGSSFTPSISGNGAWIAFSSIATNLVDTPVNGQEQVYLRNRLDGTTILVSAGPGGVPGNRASSYPSVSFNGEFVAFESEASNLVTDDGNRFTSDVFLFERAAGTITLISRNAPGASANAPSGLPSLSADGRWVAFLSAADNLTVDDAGFEFDIFLHDRLGQTPLKRVSASRLGTSADGENYYPSISADGRFVAFASEAQLLSDDRNNREDIYVFDRQSGSLERASVTSSGTGGNGDSTLPSISADGRFVVFASSAPNLTGSSSGTIQAMLRDRTERTTVMISKNLSGRTSESDVILPVISGNGRFVAFASDARDLARHTYSIFPQIYILDRLSGALGPVTFNELGHAAAEASFFASMSEDGQFMAFQSRGFNLVPADGNSTSDVFLFERKNFTADLSVRMEESSFQDGAGVIHPAVVQRAESQGTQTTRFTVKLTNAGISDQVFQLHTTNLSTGWKLFLNGVEGITGIGLQDRLVTPLIKPGASIVLSAHLVAPADPRARKAFIQFDAGDLSGAIHDRARVVVVPTHIPPAYQAVSLEADGTPGPGFSRGGVLSEDGSRIVFQSESATLVPNDNNLDSDVFVLDRQSRRIDLVSASALGDFGNSSSDSPGISGSGNVVAFASKSDNLVSNDRNKATDIFVKDLVSRRVRRVSVGSSGQEPTRGSENPALSSDGRFVVFQSMAPDLAPNDFNDSWDIFLHNLGDSSTRCLSLTPGKRTGRAESTNPQISSNGRWVAFDSRSSDLVLGDDNEETDVFLVDTSSGEMKRVSRRRDGTSPTGESALESLSADGQFVLFSSSAKDLQGWKDSSALYLYDRLTDKIEAVAPTIPGFTGDPGFASGALSSDGRFIALNSSVPGIIRSDTNAFFDVFLYDRQEGKLEGISTVHGSWSPHGRSFGARFSGNGRFLTFRSESAAVFGEGDTDISQVFVYDRATLASSISLQLPGHDSPLRLPMPFEVRVPVLIAPADLLVLEMSIRNDGSEPEPVVVALSAPTPFTATILQAGVEQANLVAGQSSSWTSPALKPGQTLDFRLQIPNPASVNTDYKVLLFPGNEGARSASLVFLPQIDGDSDGAPDAWEFSVFGGLTASGPDSDTDRDGVSNAAELAAGTDPLSGTSRFQLSVQTLQAPGSIRLTWAAANGRSFLVERAEGSPVNFRPVSGVIQSHFSEAIYEAPMEPSSTAIFYRVRLLF